MMSGQQAAKPARRRTWVWWLSGTVAALALLLGSVIIAASNTTTLSCADINSRLDELRFANMQNEFVKPANEWQSSDWSEYQNLLGKITERQNRSESCSLS